MAATFFGMRNKAYFWCQVIVVIGVIGVIGNRHLGALLRKYSWQLSKRSGGPERSQKRHRRPAAIKPEELRAGLHSENNALFGICTAPTQRCVCSFSAGATVCKEKRKKKGEEKKRK